MPRMKPVVLEQSSGKAAELLGMVQKKIGRVPNMMATLAQAPAALEAYLQFSGALGGATLTTKQREALAVFVGEKNNCAYCVKAHSVIGKKAGLSDADIEAAKQGASSDAKTKALLQLAALILGKNGHLSDAEVQQVRSAGLSDTEILETIAVVSLNIYTNYINHIADPVVDF